MRALAEIRARLDTVTDYHPAPHRAVVNSAGDRWGVVDSNGCVITTDPQDTANLYAHAPADIAKLLAAVEAVLDIHKVHGGYLHAGDVCWECSDDDCETPYPCPTVEAITKALGGTT